MLLLVALPGMSASGQGLIGFSYTQDRIFISRAQGSQIANIHLYGWGSLWPFPEGKTGEFDDGQTIGHRVREATQDGQQVMLTCATAPSDYRASGQPWNMEERVMTEAEDQYARRCAEAVKRWPEISRVQVWNELKGYWSKERNRWDYESYTRFYNKVYSAVKAARPEVLVGGGYAVISPLGRGFDKEFPGFSADSRGMEAMLYWLQHAAGYDAICLDGQQSAAAIVRITEYFRQRGGGKPIWWAEYYGSSPEEMREVRSAVAKHQEPGDVALWWAESRFPWGGFARSSPDDRGDMKP